MKFLTQWLLVLLTVLNPMLAGAALTDYDRQELAVKNWLAPFNSGFESGKAKWTASGGTLAAVTSGTNLLVGKGSATWDSGSAAQTLTSQTITIEKGYYGQNCEAGIVAQTPSGTATHLVQAYDGTNILVYATIVSSTTPRLNTVNFPCPQSGTVALRIISVAADEPLIAIDDAYLGLARNVGSTQLITEWKAWTPTIGLTGGSTTAYGKYRRTGDSVEVQFDATFTTVFTGGTASVSLPSVCSAIDTAKLPTGYATGVGLPNSNARLYDVGTGQWGGSIVYNDTTTVLMRTWTDDVGAGGNHIQVDATINTTTPFTWVNNDRVSGYFKVPCVGWTAQTVVMPDAQGWFASGTITGANPNVTGSASAYQETTNASLTMVRNPGSATVGIPCASGTTNTFGALTCASANESIGIEIDAPRSGVYEVCAQGALNIADTGSATNLSVDLTAAVNRTSEASSTVVVEGPGKSNIKYASGSSGGGEVITQHFPFNSCSTFELSSGRNTFRLMNENIVAGTGSFAYIADGDATLGNRGITFTVKPVSQQQQAILANSVSTSATNGEKIESLRVDASCTASPCAIGSQSGAFTNVTRSTTGNYSVNYPASTWSAGPRCVVTAGDANTLASCKINSSATTTSVSIFCPNTSTGTGLDSDFNIICVGPR